MSTATAFCLLVHRGGATKLWKLSPSNIRFGYAPPFPEDLTLYDGALEDVQGVIEYDESASDQIDDPRRRQIPTKYRLRVYAAGIKLDGQQLPVRETIAIQLWTGNRIDVGQKYILTVAEYQSALQDNELVEQAGIPRRAVTTTAAQAKALPPYLSRTSQLFLPYLPEIYQPINRGMDESSAFLSRFLALFESVFLPLAWTVDNFDLFLQPDSAPPALLPWLAKWYGLPLPIDQLSISQQREILRQTHNLITYTGTVVGLRDLLELYTGLRPAIDDRGLYLFSISGLDTVQLDRGTMDAAIFTHFEKQQRRLALQPKVIVIQEGQTWKIQDSAHCYLLYQEKATLAVYLEAAHFTILFTERLSDQMVEHVRLLVNLFKPAHTDYTIVQKAGM